MVSSRANFTFYRSHMDGAGIELERTRWKADDNRLRYSTMDTAPPFNGLKYAEHTNRYTLGKIPSF